MPQIIDTIRFLEWGKPAPANSEFKGVISTEKIFGTGNEGSYFGYTSRSTATESSGNEKLTMTEDGFLGYTSRDYASGGSTFSSMGWLDQDKAEEFKAEGRKAFSEKGDLIWDAVIALEDFEAAHKNGLFHTADYADAMSKVLPRFFKMVGLDPENMMWWMNYHNNTEHPHIHLCFFEKTHTRSRGKFTPRQLKEFKRLVIKELTARETLSEISGISYDEAFHRKDAERNVFLDQIRSINLLEIDSISKLASVLPKKGRLQYNSANLMAYRGQIDAITDSFLQMPEIKPAFDLYLDHLELFDQAINKNAGTDVATLKEAELKRLYAQIGNIILKTIRDTGALSRKKWKDSNIINLQLTELEDGTMKSEKGWEFKRYSELKDKLIETAVKPTSEQGMEYRRIYAGFHELMETAESAVFIVVHGDKSTYYPFVTMFIEQMYEESMAVARAHGGRMPYPVNCVFDEAGIMPSLKSIDNMVSFGASAGFRLTLAVQDTSQLEHRYGKEKSRTIMNNMQNFTYLMGGDNETLKTVSEKAGKRLVWSDERGDFEEKPVVSPDRLSVFSLGEALTIQLRRNPILTRLLGYNKYCFYKDMPKGNAEKNNTVRNVRYFDLADVYRKRESARMKADSENKTSSATDKGNSKKHAVKDRSESKADKKKPTDKPALNSSVFMDLNNVSIHEKKEA